MKQAQMHFHGRIRSYISSQSHVVLLSLAALATLFVIMYAVHEIFLLSIVLTAEYTYYYVLLGILFSLCLLFVPAAKNARCAGVPWYDYALAGLALVSAAYLGIHGWDIAMRGWVQSGPIQSTVASAILWLIALEIVRRVAGLPMFLATVLFSFYPLISSYLPGLLHGAPWSVGQAARFYGMGEEALLGTPWRTMCNLLIGFLVFGKALEVTGGGQFFIDLSLAMFGRVRAGPAKVSVVSSCLFGSISGSTLANIATTGAVTIPIMKNTGMPAHRAAAVEAVASSGGTIMPPVMGSVGFLMASILAIPYSHVIVAALIPSLMYYGALFVQIDAYAARRGVKGLPSHELPSLRATLLRGWPYLLSILVLIVLIFYLKRVAGAPFYATAVLLVVGMVRNRKRLGLRVIMDHMIDLGRFLGEMGGLLAGIGLIVGAMFATGLAFSLSNMLVSLAGGSAIPIILIAAGVSLVMGMGLPMVGCYIFLVFVVAGPLIAAGFNPIAIHLFVIYCGLLAYITPPVCLGASLAAKMAEAELMPTAISSMRMGIVLYIAPLLFIFDPHLVAQGNIPDILVSVATASLGIFLLSASMEGYLLKVGVLGGMPRILIVVSSILLCIRRPECWIAGAIVAIMTLFFMTVKRKLTPMTN